MIEALAIFFWLAGIVMFYDTIRERIDWHRTRSPLPAWVLTLIGAFALVMWPALMVYGWISERIERQ